MDFTTAIATCFRKYIDFSGRASRSEYWWWMLFVQAGSFVLSFALSLSTTAISGLSFDPTGTGLAPTAIAGLIPAAFVLLTAIPSLAVTVRRLHDLERTGGWVLVLWGFNALIVYGVVSGIMAGMTMSGGEVLGAALTSGALVLFGGIGALIMSIIFLVWMVTPGTRGDNYFGPDPLGKWSPMHGYIPRSTNQPNPQSLRGAF